MKLVAAGGVSRYLLMGILANSSYVGYIWVPMYDIASYIVDPLQSHMFFFILNCPTMSVCVTTFLFYMIKTLPMGFLKQSLQQALVAHQKRMFLDPL